MFKERIFEDFFEELSKNRQYSSYGGKCIDLFFESYIVKKPIDIINYTVQLVNELLDRNLFKFEFEIGIHIDLLNDFTYLKGVPRTIHELNDALFILSVPDIRISDLSKKVSRPNPRFEQYLSPLPFRLEGLNEDIIGFYREYRLHDQEFDWEETYTREVFLAV